jgi:hypothetical protein
MHEKGCVFCLTCWNRCFNICLSLKPGNPSVLSSIGLVHHLSNNLDKVCFVFVSCGFANSFSCQAIEFYHLALARSVAEDSFTNDMLKRALDDFQATAGK